MKPRVDHIHITVEDLGRAEKFYDRLLPLLGFDTKLKETDLVPAHEYKIIEYHHNLISIGLVNQRKAYSGEKPSRRKAGALHHLAFHAENRSCRQKLSISRNTTLIIARTIMLSFLRILKASNTKSRVLTGTDIFQYR